MKFLVLLTGVLAYSGSANSINCGEGKVPNKFNICIEPKYIEGCLQYESIEACAQCESGYNLRKGVCDAINLVDRQKKMGGCIKKSADGKTCENCANGFVLAGSGCKPGVKNCVQYDGQGCTQCRPNYNLVLGRCRYNVLLGCKKVSKDHTCEQCFAPFILKTGHCEVPNCQTLNDYGCIGCQCGFYLTKDRACNKTQDGCLRYEKARCVDCMNHYRLKGGACQIEGCTRYQNQFCVECRPEYDYVSGICQFRNCEDWGNDQCFSCKAGFRKFGGKCEKEIPMQPCSD